MCWMKSRWRTSMWDACSSLCSTTPLSTECMSWAAAWQGSSEKILMVAIHKERDLGRIVRGFRNISLEGFTIWKRGRLAESGCASSSELRTLRPARGGNQDGPGRNDRTERHEAAG